MGNGGRAHIERRDSCPRERVANAGQTQQHHRSELPHGTTAVTLLYGTHTGPTCSYCQQSHASSECATITEVQLSAKGDSQIRVDAVSTSYVTATSQEMQVIESLPTLQEEITSLSAKQGGFRVPTQ